MLETELVLLVNLRNMRENQGTFLTDIARKQRAFFKNNAEKKTIIFWGSVVPCLETPKCKTKTFHSTLSENLDSNFNTELLPTSSFYNM